MGTPAPDSVKRLVDHFDQDRKVFLSGDYKEEQLRLEFLNPFFTALGWDMDNKQGLSETFKQVIHEESIKIAGASKAPDYTFRIGGRRTFFVEAKKPAVNVAMDSAPAFQLRRYAWTARLPVSILSDFEEFAVYDCRLRPFKTDKPATARTMLLGYQDYATRWDELTGLFSPGAIQRGALERYVESTKTKKGTTAVDDAFLEEISRWRDLLAKNIALRNPRLSTRELNFAVQRTIDRLIFLRICEDRGIESYAYLQSLLNGERVYARLLKHFRDADDKYNSGLFHFSDEKGFAEPPDKLSLDIDIDDKPLKDIIGNLYYPDSPYEFSVMPADVLGQVYEQFLGKVIRLTAGHQAKVEEKPEVRKAGGVYYTPTYIVDYIVKNTVGKLLDGEGSSSPQPSPQRGEGDSLSLERESASSSSLSLERERVRVRVNQKGLTPAQASDLRILDPACGSGSFLLGAYQYLLDWHLEHYQKSVTLSAAKGLRSDSSLSVTPSSSSGQALSEAKNRRPSPSVTPSPSRGLALGSTSVPLYQDSQGNWRLTTAERKRILLNSIYGVDIDSQAVEVTKLSLLLKVLEGENQETLGSQLKLYHERALPDLGSNIKCGNSLIGPDFYQGEQQTMFADEEERLRINTFDWNQGFPDIMKAGGFDAVIGNPPYVRQELLGDLKDYFQHQFRTYHGVADLYVYFIERGVNLLSRGGLFAFIVVSKWMRTSYGQPIRDWLLTQDVKRVVDFGDLAVFKGATTYTCILVVGKGAPVKSVVVTKVHTLAFPSLDEYVQQNSYNAARKTLSSETWSLADGRSQALLVKLNEAGKPLSEYVNGRVFYGVKTGFNGAFVVDKETRSRLIKTHKSSTDVLKPFLVGKDIRRYMPLSSNRYVIFTRRGVDIDKYPAIRRYLEQFRDRITPKPPDWKGKEWHGRKPGSYKWYEIQDTVDYYPEFEKPKIVWPGISGEVCAFALDTVGYYGNDNIQIVGTDERFLLGVLNSGVAKFILKHTCDVVQGGFFRLKMVYIERLPVPCLTPGDARQGKVAALVETMLKLHKDLPKAKTPHEQESLQRQIAATDKQIDALVYELYGLTEEEIETVEVSLKQ